VSVVPRAVQSGNGNNTLVLQSGSINGHVKKAGLFASGSGSHPGRRDGQFYNSGGAIASIDHGGGVNTTVISGGRPLAINPVVPLTPASQPGPPIVICQGSAVLADGCSSAFASSCVPA